MKGGGSAALHCFKQGGPVRCAGHRSQRTRLGDNSILNFEDEDEEGGRGRLKQRSLSVRAGFVTLGARCRSNPIPMPR
jgi:hypothetical protein